MIDSTSYPEYRDSNVTWLEDIPAHWDVVPIKFSLATPITDGPHETPKLYHEGISFLSAEAVKEDKLDFSRMRGYISEEEHARFSEKYKPARGDVYMVKSGATTGNVARVETDEEFNIWSPLAAIRPDLNHLTTDFIFYFMKSRPFFYSVELSWSYGTQQNIGMGIIANLKMARPPVDEQYKIGSYLNYKTAQIDRLIEKKKALIEKLNEQRIAMITQAVTKGLNPDAPMKDSEVDWLGEVPEHWEVAKFKYQVGFQEGPGIMGADFRDSGIPLARIRNVQSQYVDLEGCNYLDPDKVETRWPHFRCQLGDLIISGSASTGLISEINYDSVGVIVYTGLIRLWAIGHIEKEFIRWFVSSNVFFSQIDRFKTGSTIQHFGPEHLNQMLISLPPIEEQREICTHLENRLRQLDSMVAVNNKTIEKLNEYRTALITAAVTGKIDVREVNVPEGV